MSRIHCSVIAALVCVTLALAAEATAGVSGVAMSPQDGQALQSDHNNQARIGQSRDEQGRGHWDRDGAMMRSWGRGGRNWLRANQGSSQNAASAEQRGRGNSADIGQFGQNLSASITQEGDGNAASIRQWGRGNTATIAQSGDNNAACLIQVGRNVNAGIVQTGGESVGIVQTRRGSREIPLELCAQMRDATPREMRGLWRRQ